VCYYTSIEFIKQLKSLDSLIGQPGTLSMLLKVLGSKSTKCKLLLVANKLGVAP
jgi:hypothetical protein